MGKIEDQVEKELKNEMGTGIIQGFTSLPGG